MRKKNKTKIIINSSEIANLANSIEQMYDSYIPIAFSCSLAIYFEIKTFLEYYGIQLDEEK